jgi:hypothetical protein
MPFGTTAIPANFARIKNETYGLAVNIVEAIRLAS